MSELISVIVPVYKVEKYLAECIISIQKQSYTNLEIILVDDGSPDLCPKLCDDFSMKDNRIKVIHKKNGGLSSARNAGLDIFTGSYVMFVDSDDVIDSNMISNLYNTLTETNTDICCCKYYKSVTQFQNINSKSYDTKTFSKIEILKDLYCNKLQNVICCNKLYKKSLFQQIRFPIGKLCEDIFTTYKVFNESKTVSKISFVGYFYRDTQGSITNTFNNRRLDSLEAYKECDDFLIKNELVELRQMNAECAMVAIMRFWYLNRDKNVMIRLLQYLDFFYPIAINDGCSSSFYIRCIIFKHSKIVNSIALRIMDKIRNAKYKNKPNIMG